VIGRTPIRALKLAVEVCGGKQDHVQTLCQKMVENTARDQIKDFGRCAIHSLALQGPKIIAFFSAKRSIRILKCSGDQILAYYCAAEGE